MSSIAASTRLAQVPTSSAEDKKIEADFNRTMKKIDFEQPMLEGITDVRDSKNPEQFAKKVAEELKILRDPTKVKQFLKDQIQSDKARFRNADSEYKAELKRPICLREGVIVSFRRNASGNFRGSVRSCTTPQTPKEIRAISAQNIKAEETLLRYFK